MLVAQLAANRAALEAGSPSRMQQLFPEGYYFSYLFHGLAWVELGMRDKSHTQQAIEEAVHRFSGEAAPVFVAGRTDKGVHALNQSAHVRF